MGFVVSDVCSSYQMIIKVFCFKFYERLNMHANNTVVLTSLADFLFENACPMALRQHA